MRRVQSLPLDLSREWLVEAQSVEWLVEELVEPHKAQVQTGVGDRMAENLRWTALAVDYHVLLLEAALILEEAEEAKAFHWVVVELDHVDLEQRKVEEDLVEAYHSVESRVYYFAS